MQDLMHKRDGNRPLAHCRRYTFETATTDITDRKNARQTRFQQMRSAD